MNPDSLPRRRFLTGAAATGAALGFPGILRARESPRNLRIGLVGCGGRGTGAAEQALSADPDVTLWALGDAFEKPLRGTVERLAKLGDRVKVAPERQFAGLDAFRKVIDSGVDVVLLATPPGFRPQHLRAAVEAGVHVFAEKPMAVDVAGVKSVLESAKLARRNNVAIQHGFCWRFDPGVRELFAKVHGGELGRVVSVHASFLVSPPKPLEPGMTKPDGMGDVEWQLRWWTNFEWTSGGPLVEQAIHSVDKVAWAMGDVAPIAAVANGGRAQRRDAGNVYDHYNVTYEYPGGVFCHVGERQYLGCHTEVCDRILCEQGTAVAPNTPMILAPDGRKRRWMYRGKPGAEGNMYQVCHNEFFAALRRGETPNAGEYMANSTMLALLGRDAAHTGQRLTWEQMWKADQDFAPDTLRMDDAYEGHPVPVPGRYRLG